MASDGNESSSESSGSLFAFVYTDHIDPEVVGEDNYPLYCELAERLGVQSDDIPASDYKCTFTFGTKRTLVRVRLDIDDHGTQSFYLWFNIMDGAERGSYYHRVTPANPMTPAYFLGLVRCLLMTSWE